MFSSLRARLSVLWVMFLLTTLAAGAVIVSLWHQSTAAQVARAAVAISRDCALIRDQYRFYATDWATPPQDLADPTLVHGLTAVVQTALLRSPGVEGGLWQQGHGSLAYAFPTYEGTGPKTDLPVAEAAYIRDTADQAVVEQSTIDRRFDGRAQVLLLQSCPLAGPIADLAAWTMTRVHTQAGAAYTRTLIGLGVLVVMLIGSAAWLSWTLVAWSRAVRRVELALGSSMGDVLPLLPPSGEPQLDRLVAALNATTARLGAARQRSAELALRVTQSERLAALGRVIAGIAHEIRNPIGAMRLRAENALAGDLARKDTALTVILTQIDRLDGLLRNLLESSHSAPLTLTTVDLPGWFKNRMELHRDEAAHRGIACTTEVATDRAVIDPDRLGRALDNLVLNAFQATPRGGSVRVNCEGRGDRLVLVVEDTGRGIPAELRDRLFEPFATGRADGTGLGLAIVRETAEAHGGTARAISRPGGTTLEIELPWRRS